MGGVTFVHLHALSHYSLLASPTPVPRLVAAAKAMGCPAVALTDRGGLFGAVELQTECRKAGIQPIIGCQVSVAPFGIGEKSPPKQSSQLVLLAATAEGYRNLARLVSRAWLDGFYFEPRIDLDLLAAHAPGLICLTGAGGQGFINRHLVAGAGDEAARQLGLLRECFGDRLYAEVTAHDPTGAGLTAAMAAVAGAAGVPLAATANALYLARSDARTHDIQLAVGEVTTLADPRRPRMDADAYWLRTPAEMAEAFPDHPQALAATLEIAQRCREGVIPTGSYFLPRFPCPDGLSEAATLRRLAEAGVRERYGEPSAAVRERLEFELTTIEGMGFPAYFLIVADFIGWAKRQGIPVGPGRGSAAGSLVAYALGITDLCPLAYGLLFERFLNPGRKSMPDIDVDFCRDGRERVIRYVSDKYGASAVTQIMTLGTMKARMAIKDVARALEWTPEEAQALANLVPEDPSGKHDLAVCLGLKPLDKEKNEYGTVDAMVQRRDGDPRAAEVLLSAMALEKTGRSLGVHACGIIIAPGPVSDVVPVCQVKGKPATQYNMSQVEQCGLLKMDFLGLKTMSILKKAADIARAVDGAEIDLLRIPLDDPRTFALLGTGETLGVFQCESSGFQELIRRLKPDRFADMIALVALYRPGPLMANMHIDYCDRKHGVQQVDYPHPVLEGVLKETYGLYIYQEQVMSISRELCGFTPAQADDLRKAMGKKDLKTLQKLEHDFVEGAFARHGFPREACRAMWTKILGFASYCFNKSHSACYGLIAYWTAYMKANHYAAFMTANLIYEMDHKEKMTLFVEELRAKGIPVLPPDVNRSGFEFTVQRDAPPVGSAPGATAIRFGFGGVKGVGELAARHLIERRSAGAAFASLAELCERCDPRIINKRVLEALIKVGACDGLHPNRAALIAGMERAMDRAGRVVDARSSGQTSLFGVFEADESFRAATQGYPDVPDWSPQERLAHEKALTGYWISSHPVREAGPVIAAMATTDARGLAAMPNGWRATVAAVVTGKRVVRTRTGKSMAIVQCEDPGGRFEAVLFPGGSRRDDADAFQRFAGVCEPDTVALFTGAVARRSRSAPRPPAGDDAAGEDAPPAGDEDAAAVPVAPASEEPPSLQISDVVPTALLFERLARSVTVGIDLAAAADRGQVLRELDALLADHRGGRCRIQLQLHDQGRDGATLTLDLGEANAIHPRAEALERLRRWSGGRLAVATDSAAAPPLLR